MDYNKEFPFDEIEKDEEVFILDFSLQKEGDFGRLLEKTMNVTWIDHHKTAIDKHENKGNTPLDGIRRNGVAACELTWEYFFGIHNMPMIVSLLGDYDTWTLAGIKLYDTRPASEMWPLWFANANGESERLRQDGLVVNTYQAKQNKGIVETLSFFVDFEGFKVVACNTSNRSSMVFDSVDESKYDIMAPFAYDGKRWTVSLYTKKDIDVSEIAKKYGGGGHKQAAGFVCEKLPFLS
jgi:oligoribonuclease NrnB/cAMP/cGMP phosphodiesterase (DHH superfamily)